MQQVFFPNDVVKFSKFSMTGFMPQVLWSIDIYDWSKKTCNKKSLAEKIDKITPTFKYVEHIQKNGFLENTEHLNKNC